MLRFRKLLLGASACLLAAFAAGCVSLSAGASGGYYASFVHPAPEFTLVASGLSSGTPPSDEMVPPLVPFRFAVYEAEANDPLMRAVTIAESHTSRGLWRWSMESRPSKEALSFTKSKEAGQFMTLTIFPVLGKGDFFSALRAANGKPVPKGRLTARWSATPFEHVRVAAEYSEKMPDCIDGLMTGARDGKPEYELVDPTRVWAACRQDVDAFKARAEAAVIREKSAAAPFGATSPTFNMPKEKPSLGKLMGTVERIHYNDDGVFMP